MQACFAALPRPLIDDGKAAGTAVRGEEGAVVGGSVDGGAAGAPTQCREKVKVTVRGSAVSS